MNNSDNLQLKNYYKIVILNRNTTVYIPTYLG